MSSIQPFFSILFIVNQIFYLQYFFNDTSTHDKKKYKDHINDLMTSKKKN
jgi:hypothetical protein